ncbi:MAG: hypothetical protein R3F43_09525 [bacterium]
MDEFVGLSAERQLTRLVAAVDQSPLAGVLADVRGRAVARILAERERRATHGFGERDPASAPRTSAWSTASAC